ncbi:class I SAM-dependent methyltransferase [Methylobacterium sp. NMS14P]|uniref:class I SAM-dependent methyltransferase n=1 Tax=Methylobacterium sp. NMS14P TaxID=2894310 RepID=UPI0023585E56|nr:class I SAM-dependent methyltransferase [Methylobacterium sp. NMS14P]WCS24672.1 class I SAM-dependent methyltransferase [Methylobacterium sp. NMS14P]
MPRPHETVVADQFGTRARAYVTSAVHAAGEDLDALEAAAAREKPERAIDLGTGGGHVAYRLAPHARSVTAVDLAQAMTEAVASTARERGLSNIGTQVAAAERLPFDDAAFDFLGCRFSAHHWRDFEGGLKQARRVLRDGATAIFIDVVSPGHAALDTHLQAVEVLRDPSHARNYTGAEWQAALTRAGFRVRATHARRLRMHYPVWVDRMQTPESHRAAIRSLQRGAASETATHFEIGPDGSFTLDVLSVEASACRARSAC